eukprot:9990417-Alexandrium_andersonii.AAC.1
MATTRIGVKPMRASQRGHLCMTNDSLLRLQKTRLQGKTLIASKEPPTSGRASDGSRRSPGRRPSSGTAAVKPLPRQPLRLRSYRNKALICACCASETSTRISANAAAASKSSSVLSLQGELTRERPCLLYTSDAADDM